MLFLKILFGRPLIIVARFRGAHVLQWLYILRNVAVSSSRTPHILRRSFHPPQNWIRACFLSLLDPCIPEIHFQDIECRWFEDDATFTNLHTLSMICDLQYDKIHEYIRLFPALRDSCIRGGLSVEHVPPLRSDSSIGILPSDNATQGYGTRCSLCDAHRPSAPSIAQVRTRTTSQSVFDCLRCIVDLRLSIPAPAAALVTDTSVKLRRHSNTQLFAGSWISSLRASSQIQVPILRIISGLPGLPRRLRTNGRCEVYAVKRHGWFLWKDPARTYYHRKIALNLIAKN
ncbi:hypothetical protein C8R44DRAFT_725020 [Mycena epipterygia]|nr:hypothetical protein C8R44DRAFT_725020 [Mycena epipterygia]